MCNCIEGINAKLAPDHSLNCTMAFRKGEIERPIMGLIRRDTWKLENRRGKTSFFVGNYCPFCGAAYAEPASAETSEAAQVVQPIREDH
jgi:hypothetical protein